VLYAMCTGRAPFRASTTMAVLKRVCEEAPRPIREVNSEIPDWLVAIIDRLHAKDPAGRFQSAGEVAELLSQHLAHLQQPALVPPPAGLKKAAGPPPAAKPRGHRWAMAAAVLVLLLGGLGLTEATGVTKVVPAVIRIVTGDGTLVVEVGDPEVSVTIDGQDLVITGAGPKEVRLRPGTYQVRASKDGVPVPLDNDLVTITRGGKQVVKVSREGAGQAQAGPPIKLRATLRGEGNLTRVAFAPDGSVLASAQDDGRVILWDVAAAQVKMALEGHKPLGTAVAFSPDGKTLASAAGDWRKPDVNGEVKLWDPETGKLLFTLPSSTGPIYSVAFAPDGKTLAAVGQKGTVQLWDPATGKEQEPLKSPKGTAYALAYAPDGKTLAVSHIDLVQLWDVATRQKKGLLSGHLDEVECVAFSPDGQTLATGSRDRTIKLWDVATLQERVTLRGHPAWVRSVAFAPDGKTLASSCHQNVTKLWDVASGKTLFDVPQPGIPAGSTAAFTADGKTLAVGGSGTIRLWDVAPEPSEEGWVQLFNGKDLSGWKTHPDQPGGWSVQDGLLVGRGQKTHLFSRRGDYEDFHLRFEAKVNAGGDSGVFFRAPFSLKPNWGGPLGYEAQVAARTGTVLVGEEVYGGPAGLAPDTWFTGEVIATGNRIVVRVNGETTANFDDPKRTYAKGHLALQVWHPDTVVQFRKVEIKELPATKARPGAGQTPAAGEVLEELRGLVTIQQENLQKVQLNYKAGRVTRLEVCAAEDLLIEARVKLAAAEQKPVVALLEDLVRNREEELRLIETRFEVGTVAETEVLAARQRLSEARVRLAAARAESPEAKPFVLPGNDGKAGAGFATLAEAVAAARDGDTIEVRGDGPFWVDAAGLPIERPLTIRAGPGCRPVFKLAQAAPGQVRNKHILDVYAPVTLEGLDFDRTGEHEGTTRERAALYVQNAPLRMANCRLRTGGLAHYLVWLRSVPEADIRNCLFAGPALRALSLARCSDGDRLALTNCVFARMGEAVLFTEEQDRPASSLRVRLVHDTWNALPLAWHQASGRELQVEARGNVVVGYGVIDFLGFPRGQPWKELAKAVRWEGGRNLYPAGRPLVVVDRGPQGESAGLDVWNALWQKPEEGSQAGAPKFQGGAEENGQPPMLEPGYWRLAAASPGKGAGEGGRDLGADVDRVGPGPAYERWKQTPEYQQWLKDTGQARRDP
jgi:WD40 repeat protein